MGFIQNIRNLFGRASTTEKEVQEGRVIDYGNGQIGLPVIMTPEMAKTIANGMALNNSDVDYSGIEDFYKDPELLRKAQAASVRKVNPYNLTFFDDEVGLSTNFESAPEEAMRLAEKYFRADSIAGKVIELMAQFSIAGMRHQLNDEKVKQFYDQWAYQVGFTSVLQRVFLNYYLYGNVYILKTLVNFKQGPIDPNFKYQIDPESSAKAFVDIDPAIAKLYVESYNKYLNDEISAEDMIDIETECLSRARAARKNVWSKSMIPGNFTILDPKAIELHGPGDFGLGVMTYTVSDTFKKMINDPTSVVQGVKLNPQQIAYQKKLILQIPKDIIAQIKSGSNKIVLDPNLVSSVHRMKLDFETLAYPLMTRAFKALHMKNRLREMDNAVINSLIGQMIIIKVGSDKFPAKPAQLQALAEAYQQAVQTKSLVLFWNHTLAIERIPVELDILGSEKYEIWNNDIRDAFGISPLLLGRNEGASGTAFMAVKGFLENLQQGRDDVLEQFVYPEYHGIAVAMGFKGFPEVVFDSFRLEDESSAINVLVRLIQAGVVDRQTVAEKLNYDWKQTVTRFDEQSKLVQQGILPPIGASNNAVTLPDGGRPGNDGEPGGQPNSRPKNKNANPQPKVVEEDE